MSRTILQRLQVPIDLARLVLAPILVFMIALGAANASMQLSNATVSILIPFSIAIPILIGCGILGGLVVVLVAPHQTATNTGAAWTITTMVAIGTVILARLIDHGPDVLLEVDFQRLAGYTLLTSLTGLCASYPISMARNRLVPRSRSEHEGFHA